MYSSELKKGTINIGNKNSYGDAFSKNSIDLRTRIYRKIKFIFFINNFKNLLRIKEIDLYDSTEVMLL